jgi:hypothetical protein
VEGKFDICKTFDKTSLTPPLFMEVSGPSQENERLCTSMSVRGIYFVSIVVVVLLTVDVSGFLSANINKNIIYFNAINAIDMI